ncbi:unnamed protein product [Staurois parvus]|uniref:Uncharacterized protein n=1 Tax=Staurois parvus TaxID=386267 RepID=A0ABN9ESR2_9NEOB|nr:unnamed protein product [Staurois parvus]
MGGQLIFLPLKPTMGQYCSHWLQQWGTRSSTDTNDGALFMPLIPMMGHYSSFY